MKDQYTYVGSLSLENGKIVTAECDRYGSRLEEATATIRHMFEKLVKERDWSALWPTFEVVEQPMKARA